MPAGAHDASPSASKRILHPAFLLVAATVWHVLVAVSVFVVGKYQIIPSQFYPNGIGRFALDGIAYQDQCVELRSILWHEGFRAWATWPTQLHVRLYSLPFAVMPESVGLNVLTIEPLNLLYYLAIVVLVFMIGKRLFDHQTGLLAAAIVALWPTFVLHTTQLLRDPLLVLSVLVFVWSVVESLRRVVLWRRALLLGISAIGAIICIRIVRLPMWYVLCGGVAAAIVLLIIQAVRQRHIGLGKAVFALLILMALVITPEFQTSFHNQQELRTKRAMSPEEIQKLPVQEQIAARREAWKFRLDNEGNVVPAEDGSRIDTDVHFDSLGGIIRHLPRGIIVGFFAPFPNMWLHPGYQVGYGGRIISGFETILTYVIECLALFGLWRARKDLSIWFMALFIALGVVALGLVVNNVGALYRLRYPFWVMLVIVGAGGAIFLIRRTSLRKKSQAFKQILQAPGNNSV